MCMVLRVHDLYKLIYNSTFFFKLLPQLFQNIQACLFNIDLNTKLRTRLDKKIVLMSINYCGIIYMYLNRYCLQINHLQHLFSLLDCLSQLETRQVLNPTEI